ncbi:HutD family protein [Pendulispora albinea]|uniref:HutD family protein n=2 Tax=Pendulispora albinea TaxID=2741071 RepID=A0ABZ2LM80_9BACT
MPWRNGGGTTTEIAIDPEGAALSGERFIYRISVADVASDGPFSRFEGYDRHIMLLEGAGMTLDCGAHGRVELARPLEPRTFSGDWDVHGTLLDGPVRDFNVIVDRARASATLTPSLVSVPSRVAIEAGETCLIHVLSGELAQAPAGDTLVAQTSFDLEPRTPSRIALIRIVVHS